MFHLLFCLSHSFSLSLTSFQVKQITLMCHSLARIPAYCLQMWSPIECTIAVPLTQVPSEFYMECFHAHTFLKTISFYCLLPENIYLQMLVPCGYYLAETVNTTSIVAITSSTSSSELFASFLLPVSLLVSPVILQGWVVLLGVNEASCSPDSSPEISPVNCGSWESFVTFSR